MSVEVQNVQRLRVLSESSFASDGTGSLGSYTEVPAIEGTISAQVMIDSIDDGSLVQHLYGYREETLGKRSATLAFTMALAPTGTAAVTGQSAVTGPLGTILKAVMGSETKAAGSTSSTGSTGTVVNVQAGHGSRWVVGGAMGWVNSSGVLECREVESIATDAVTLKHAFSGSPANTDPLYNAATYAFAQDPTESLQFILSGAESDDRWLFLGGQCTGMTLAFDVTGAAMPKVTFSFMFADWKTSAETSGSITGSIGTSTYTNFSPIVGFAGDCRVYTVAASTFSTSTRVHCSAIAFNPKVSFVPVTSPSGTNTIQRWRRARQIPPVEGSWTEIFQDLTRWTARSSRTDYNVTYQMGTAAGSTVYITAPRVQVVNPQRVPDAQQLAGQTVTWKGRTDGDTFISAAPATTDVGTSPFRIHLF